MTITRYSKDRLYKQVTRLVKKWQSILGLQNYRINIEFAHVEDHIAMYIDWNAHYRKALLVINEQIPSALDVRPDVLEANVVHELVHLLISPIKDLIETEFAEESVMQTRYTGAQEDVTDTITSIIMRLHGRA